MCIQGGYKAVTPIEIANCLAANSRGEIRYRAVRVYFAALALVAVREGAARRRRKNRKKTPVEACYRVSELCMLTGLTEKAVKCELRSLKRASLLEWSCGDVTVNSGVLPGSEILCEALSGKRSAKRPIPVPRSVLRFVAVSTKGALGKTMLAYVARGLSIERSGGAIKAAGTVKASWIAKALGLSLRSVKLARKELIARGFITKDSGSFQRKLNRDGSYFRVNLTWKEGESRSLRISPLGPKMGGYFAPPYKYKKTSNESKNQKTQSGALNLAGVCKANTGGEPTLRDVKREDLKRLSRLKPLFVQAVRAGWMRGSEADYLNWVSAAVRANSVGAREPVRVFVSIVKQRRWDLINQKQEDRAREAIRRDREKGSGEEKMFHASEGTTEAVAVTLSRLKL